MRREIDAHLEGGIYIGQIAELRMHFRFDDDRKQSVFQCVVLEDIGKTLNPRPLPHQPGSNHDLETVLHDGPYRVFAAGATTEVVPGSAQVRKQAMAEGLHKVFLDAGAEWRFAGCSMCLAMNTDQLKPGERCAATSNRNFEGRQGKDGRTHLVSPEMAAAAAIEGHFVDIRKWK